MPNFTREIRRFDELDSTNLKCRELALIGLKEGTVVVANRQTAGRGSGTRTWHSPIGGLYLSVLLRPNDPKRSTDLSILAGVALSQAVKQLLPKSVDITVKWPNDCLVNWKKVGGILCENLGEAAGNSCVVGIGLNINLSSAELAPFLDNPFSATSFLVESGTEMSKDEALNTLLAKIFTLYEVYKKDGFEAVRYLWEKNCHFIGKKIELRDSGWREAAVKGGKELGSTKGTFLGIDDSGALVLSNSKGERRQYVTGEITCYWS